MARPEIKRKWLITGASGLLGHQLCRYLVERGHHVVGIAHRHPIDVAGVDKIAIDLEHHVGIRKLVEKIHPHVVLHAAGLTNVDACELNASSAAFLHVTLAHELADAARNIGARSVIISTDHLWDGSKANVSEDEPVKPLNMYARTKAEGETAALSADPAALVVRTNFFGVGRPWRQSLSDWLLSRLRGGETVPAFADVFFTPIALPYLCSIIEELVEKQASGVFHVAGAERLSKYAFARCLAEHFGLPQQLVVSSSLTEAQLKAPRPRDMSVSTEKIAAFLGRPMPDVRQSFASIGAEMGVLCDDK